MTTDEAATIQAGAAIAQTVLALVIGGATWRYAHLANKVLRLQTESSIAPSVSVDLYAPYVAASDEPLNFLLIKNHSPVELGEMTLSAAIFGRKADCPTEVRPFIQHIQVPEELAPEGNVTWCIDDVLEKAVEVMKIGPDQSSVVKGVSMVFVRFHLRYRRKSDGAPFKQAVVFSVHKKPDTRPVAVYLDYRAQLA